ncbi:Putative sterol reductase [Colletotrichum destructivum]|uniref:Delta(14)-sterol reductase n=1 Tax=Colletotrichum destructivum TaxID=34406 RepID=A0AAX4J4B9_9PEZI|nr:Putative sterol reductase [Colletotrichum destructivum]
MPVKEHTYQFGGPSGAFRIMVGLPMLLYTFYFVCNDKTGCPAPSTLSPRTLTLAKFKVDIPWPDNGIWGFCNWHVFGYTLAYYLLSLVLHRILPAKEVYGRKLAQSGRPLKYRFNTFNTTIVQLVGLAAGTYLKGADFVVWTFISDNYLQLLTANIIIGFALAVYIYIASFSVKPGNSENREIAVGGDTGNLIYDFYIGRELNPRVTLPFFGEIDIKTWFEFCPSLSGWLILNLAFCAKQYRNYGSLSNSIIFTTAIQAYYVLEGQYHEAGIVTMMDVIQDGMGFMLSFGDVAWVPFLYSTQTRYLSIYPVHLSWPGLTAASIVFAVGLFIFRSSNTQKRIFRVQPDHPSVKDMPYIQTKRGTRLLTGGWWGMARHINYFGDWLQASPFSLPTAVAGYVILPAGSAVSGAITMLDGREVVQGAARGWGMIFTYFYVLYFATLLIHRERRDNAACSLKYGKDWDEYESLVKWKIIPGLF